MAADVITKTLGRCGVVTLNQPKALNALDRAMLDAIAAALDEWERDPSVASVVIRGAGERAFCAGADIRALLRMGEAGDFDAQQAFFRAEYSLNRRIGHYPKPIVALADRIVMGGGAGLSVHATHCVAGESLDFAMPEVGIGFFPDVGATCFLSRLPDRIGVYLALTGARIGCGDAVALGLASAFAPAARHAALTQRLIDGEEAAAAVAAESASPPAPALAGRRKLIARCFAASTVGAIAAALDAEAADFAGAARAALAAKSPTSLAIALRQMQIGQGLGLDAALKMEFRICSRLLRTPDFYEGVRAAVVDKDHRPRWTPDEPAAVAAVAVDAFFAPIADELTFPALVATQ